MVQWAWVHGKTLSLLPHSLTLSKKSRGSKPHTRNRCDGEQQAEERTADAGTQAIGYLCTVPGHGFMVQWAWVHGKTLS